jgi:hypothetical protein
MQIERPPEWKHRPRRPIEQLAHDLDHLGYNLSTNGGRSGMNRG